MSVNVGETIIEIQTGRKLIVQGLWGKASKSIDFSAMYQNRFGIDNNGGSVFTSRGFRFQDENIVWKKEDKQ